MDKILELREKRAKAWEAAKAFLDAKRGADGLLAAEDVAAYEKMEADVVNLGKEIDRAAAEYLIFTCGALMTGLVPEIEKIAAYAKGKTVTQADIDAVADPVLSAEVFKLSDAVLQGRHDQAASILGDLLKMQTEPIMILAALGSQLRRIWTARLALDSGRDRYWLMELWGMKSDYPAKLLLNAARRTTAEWCAQAVRRCQELDRRMKSERGVDSAGELKLLLVWLAAERS